MHNWLRVPLFGILSLAALAFSIPNATETFIATATAGWRILATDTCYIVVEHYNLYDNAKEALKQLPEGKTCYSVEEIIQAFEKGFFPIKLEIKLLQPKPFLLVEYVIGDGKIFRADWLIAFEPYGSNIQHGSSAGIPLFLPPGVDYTIVLMVPKDLKDAKKLFITVDRKQLLVIREH